MPLVSTRIAKFLEENDTIPSSDQAFLRGLIGASGKADWNILVTRWTTPPVPNAETITGGSVYDYTYGSTTYYRFVPDPYDPTDDVFYSAFVAGVLSIPIAARSMVIYEPPIPEGVYTLDNDEPIWINYYEYLT